MAMSSQPQSSQSGELTSDDLQEVFEAVYSIAPNYVPFCVKLNVSLHNIRVLERQYSTPYDCLLEILDFRLKQLPRLTWHDIVRALRSPTVQQHDLARTIESQYITASQSPASVSQQASAESSHVATHTSGALPSTHAPSQPPLHTVAAAFVPLTHTPQPPIYNTGEPLQLTHASFPNQPSMAPNSVAPNPAYNFHLPFYQQQYFQSQPPSQHVRHFSSQQATYFPSQFQQTYPYQHRFPMQQNPLRHFSFQQPAALPLNPRFLSGVAYGEAANAAASSVRHQAPQPANLPFQSQGVQRTPTQPQFAGIPSITATDQPQPPSQFEPPTVRGSSSQQANYFPSQFQPTYPYQHSFPMQQKSYTHFPIPQPAALPLNPRFTSSVTVAVAAGVSANAAASSVRQPAPQPANLPFQSEGVQRTHTQPQFAGIPSTTAIGHFQNPTHITSTDAAISHTAPQLPPLPTDSHNASEPPTISAPQHNLTDHTDMHTSSSNMHQQHQQLVHVHLGPNSPPMQSQSPSLHSDPPQAKRPRHDTSVAQLSEPLPPQGSVTSQHDALYPPDFTSYVKKVYKRSKVGNPKDTKWPPMASKHFINLVIINRETVSLDEADEYTKSLVMYGDLDAILHEKKPIKLAEIAKDVPEDSIILVEGAPGVGKSTFAWEFCRRWERGEIAQQYQLVLLLRLRDEGMSYAKSLEDLIRLYHHSDTLCQTVLHTLKASRGESSLIILEGFDELPSTCRTESSVFLKLISGKVLEKATVLITSRHWATRIIQQTNGDRIFQHIEILGFTEPQIKEYIRSIFVDKQTDPDQIVAQKINEMETYVEKYPQIKACMYIPLNTAIVVNIHQESKANRCILPRTLTELYYALTQTLLLRYLKGHRVYGQKRNWTINDIISDIPEFVCRKLRALCHEAYKGICTADGDSVQLIFYLHPDFETLGFMQSVPQLYTTQGAVMSHNFLHLTVQEFLAALHISFMSPEQQLLHLKRHNEGTLKVVLRFLAGLTKLANISLDQIKGLFGKPLQENESSQGKYCTCMTPDISVSVHHTNWMFETQTTEIIKTLLENATVELVCEKGMVPLEYYCVGYCIAHSQCNWCLTFAEDIEDEKLKMFLTEINKTGEGTEHRVAVKTNQPMSSETLNILFAALGQWLEEMYLKVADNGSSLSLTNLSALHILELGMCSKSTLNLSSDFSLQSLESLTINAGNAGNTLGHKSCEAIGEFLSTSTSLKELHFNAAPKKTWSMSTKGMEAITKSMSDNMALPLRSLQIECKCTFSNTAATSLALFIKNSTSLRYVRMCNITISVQRLQEVHETIHNCSSLQEKKLELLLRIECSEDATKCTQLFNDYPDMLDSIDWEATSRISKSVKQSDVLRLSAITIGLYHNRISGDLHLSHNNISDAGATDLAQALHHNSTLKVLDLSKNNISDVGATDLAQALHHNSTLERLDLEGNESIGEEGTRQLVQALTVKTSINRLLLPKRCEEYASQCMEYNAVKTRITFIKF